MLYLNAAIPSIAEVPPLSLSHKHTYSFLHTPLTLSSHQSNWEWGWQKKLHQGKGDRKQDCSKTNPELWIGLSRQTKITSHRNNTRWTYAVTRIDVGAKVFGRLWQRGQTQILISELLLTQWLTKAVLAEPLNWSILLAHVLLRQNLFDLGIHSLKQMNNFFSSINSYIHSHLKTANNTHGDPHKWRIISYSKNKVLHTQAVLQQWM